MQSTNTYRRNIERERKEPLSISYLKYFYLKEIDVLKYELKFARSAAHSKFEQDLEAKSIEL